MAPPAGATQGQTFGFHQRRQRLVRMDYDQV